MLRQQTVKLDLFAAYSPKEGDSWIMPEARLEIERKMRGDVGVFDGRFRRGGGGVIRGEDELAEEIEIGIDGSADVQLDRAELSFIRDVFSGRVSAVKDDTDLRLSCLPRSDDAARRWRGWRRGCRAGISERFGRRRLRSRRFSCGDFRLQLFDPAILVLDRSPQ